MGFCVGLGLLWPQIEGFDFCVLGFGWLVLLICGLLYLLVVFRCLCYRLGVWLRWFCVFGLIFGFCVAVLCVVVFGCLVIGDSSFGFSGV